MLVLLIDLLVLADIGSTNEYAELMASKNAHHQQRTSESLESFYQFVNVGLNHTGTGTLSCLKPFLFTSAHSLSPQKLESQSVIVWPVILKCRSGVSHW
jgi:hypothetical protein